jgi:signal transduction histidine kinase
MVGGGDGRLWLATIDGVAWVDPANLPSNPTPPGVVITSLTSGKTVIKDPAAARLEPGTSDITIGFAALSLAMPERVKVLYRLEGHDRDWVDPGSRRQAFYTNLAPGEYRFQVIAANEDGVWNRTGDALTISIPPTFIQSWPFKLLCALLVLLLVWIAYSIRLRTVAERIRMRMAERIGERERIARELHDTLLQSVQSLTLRFQLAVDELPDQAPARPVLEKAIDDADLVIAEGRDRVRDLRPAAQEATIEQVVRDIVDRQMFGAGVEVSVEVSGSPRALDPLVLDEVARISSEAIFNIWRHAEARRVAIEIGYHAAFSVRFADDGKGIDAETALVGQKPGHFGLPGMRERARKLSGGLVVRRLPEGGSEVIVTVPGAVAYRALRSLFGRKASAIS